MAETFGILMGFTALVTRVLRRRQRQDRLRDDNSGIIQLYGSNSASVDICFVHGLAGDRIQTWNWVDDDSKETHFWPADFLPQDAEEDHLNVRILSYGYKSFAPTPEYLTQRTLYRHSQSLLSALASVRKDCSDRPLIFVGHSLGGIVIKSALIFSSQDKNPDLLALSLSTTGILFLGTPHNETMSSLDQSKWPRTLASIVELTKVGNPSLVKHLEKQSLSLQSRLQPFKALSDNISIVSYYEEIPNSMSSIVVPKPSTRLLYGDKVDIIHASHRNMCKFSSRDNPDYKKVSHELMRQCHESRKRSQDNWEKHKRNRREEVSVDYIERVHGAEAEEQMSTIAGPDNFRVHDSFLPPRNKRFVGRVKDLDFLRKILLEEYSPPQRNTCATVNLFGSVGIGKTEIAQEFAHLYRDHFTSVFWIPATSQQSIERGLVNIATILRQQIHGPSSTTAFRILADSLAGAEFDGNQLDQTIKAVMEWFQSTENSRWLVIVDGLEHADDHDIMKFIPRTTCSHGHCIITSREAVEWNFVETHQVHPFSPDESFSLLKASTGLLDANEHDLDKLSRSLQHLPLALSAAASYISSTKITIQKYMQSFRASSNPGKVKPVTSLEDELIRVEKLLLNTINNVPDTPRLLKSLSLGIFQVCCALSMESVCLSIFLSSSFKRKYRGNTMAAIRELEHNSLIALTEDKRYLITQNTVLEHSCRLLPDDQRQSANQIACESALSAAKALQQLGDEDKSVDTSFAECDLAAVISRCYQIIETNIHASHEWEIDLDFMGRVCERQGRTEDAIKFYNMLVSQNGGNVSVTRRAKMRLAITRRVSGGDVRAECEELVQSKDDILSESTASIQEGQPFGDEVDIEALRLLRKMAHDRSTPEEELAISRQIAAVQEYRLGHKHPSTLDAVQQLAKDLVEVGFYDEAEANMRRVLLSYENMARANYTKTTEACETLASIRLKQGKYDDAKELFNRALHNHLARLGREHPTTQKCWSQLGQVYDMQNRFDIASLVYDKCIAVLDTTQGTDHPDVLRVHSYKAENLANRNMYDEAEKELRTVLELMKADKNTHHESDRRRTALQLVEILKKNPEADDAAWMAAKVQDLEFQYDLDLHRRIGWMY
ncbi:uncharacterized protein GGS22DRAFT_173908 [Annulohypoxylon maeteangense]|uniref:uncharacterized protein n=1 Tax=Annulohypoxylon maeteangense TaxID=1927788 RepID=UPI002008CB1D|nr:uncharacterized protein GGS22DRAFT_173908 [Annulohypoxylon maeteangense]KAI0880981.1 hypothetical protein GGS22DRAFT_173908 [Annulohypoxylon maeteangense]